MSTRKPTGAHAGATPHVDGTPWNDLPRQQMAATAQAACALFRGFEAIRRIQQKTAHQALAHRQVIAEKLREPCQPMDLVAIQSELLRFDAQGAAMYWQQLAGAVMEMQREFIASAVPQAGAGHVAAGVHGEPARPGLDPFHFQVDSGPRAAAG